MIITKESQNEYISIARGTWTHNIDNMSLFVGKNGSGKTHLLRAIREGVVAVEAVPKAQIAYFDTQAFSNYSPTEIVSGGLLAQNKDQAWTYYQSGQNSILNKSVISNVENQCFNQSIDNIHEICQSNELSIFDEGIISILRENNPDYENMRATFIQKMHSLTGHQDFLNSETPGSIFNSVCKKCYSLPSRISESEFKDLFVTSSTTRNPIISNLSFICYEFYRKKRLEYLEKSQNDSSLQETDFYSDAPWKILLELFAEIDFGFTCNSPEIEKPNIMNGAFSLKLKKKSDSREVKFKDLSSGEKILFMLINAIYTIKADGHDAIKLILLDEIDSPLNPTIIPSFIKAINKISEDENINFIIASHSPTTTSMFKEDSIFFIDSQNTKPIRNIDSKQEAIELLTEGIVTMSNALDLVVNVKVDTDIVVISEGKNKRDLHEALDIYCEDENSDLKDRLEVIGIKELGGDALSLLFRFGKTYNTNKKIVFVWDWDWRLERNVGAGNTHNIPYLLNYNSDYEPDGKKIKGIENMYPPSVFNKYTDNGSSFTETKQGSDLLKVSNKDYFFRCVKDIQTSDGNAFEKFKPFFRSLE